MRSLFLIAGYSCNLRCDYCFYSTGYARRRDLALSLDEWKVAPRRLSHLGFDAVVVTGGEPLHQKHRNASFGVIKLFKDSGLEVILNTTGTGLGPKDLDQVVELGIDRVDISIDSHLRCLHNMHRGLFDDTVSTIKGLVNRGHGCIVSTTVLTRQNSQTISETVWWLKSLGIHECRVQPVFVPGCDNNTDQLLALMRQTPTTPISQSIINYLELVVSHRYALPPGVNCDMGVECFVSDPTGELSPCFHRLDDHVGNLLTDDPDYLEAIMCKQSHKNPQPGCYGPHCASLFNTPAF